MDDLWVELIGTAVGSSLSTLAALYIALFTIRRENQAALKQKADLVRCTLATEVELLLTTMKQVTAPEVPPIAGLATLGSVKIQVYPSMVVDVGVLGPELAGQVVYFYAHVTHLMDRGIEFERDYKNPEHLPGIDADAKAWIDQLRGMIPGFETLLAKLKSDSGAMATQG